MKFSVRAKFSDIKLLTLPKAFRANTRELINSTNCDCGNFGKATNLFTMGHHLDAVGTILYGSFFKIEIKFNLQHKKVKFWPMAILLVQNSYYVYSAWFALVLLTYGNLSTTPLN